MEKIVTDMDFEDDVAFYRSSRIVKIVVVSVMFVVSMACLTGIFGYGFWTKKITGQENDMLLEYECFLRVTKETPLTCYVNTASLSDSLFRISVNTEYLKKVELKSVVPQPVEVTGENDRITFLFKAVPGNELQFVSFTTIAKRSGKIAATVRSGQRTYNFDQFIYP